MALESGSSDFAFVSDFALELLGKYDEEISLNMARIICNVVSVERSAGKRGVPPWNASTRGHVYCWNHKRVGVEI